MYIIKKKLMINKTYLISSEVHKKIIYEAERLKIRLIKLNSWVNS